MITQRFEAACPVVIALTPLSKPGTTAGVAPYPVPQHITAPACVNAQVKSFIADTWTAFETPVATTGVLLKDVPPFPS
ncbi:hypothetical protein EME01_58890 [Sinorhizobium meliloti]|nr:hypothetical protein EME01_58890 [Sinorhizobium meliloti]